jgi:hypothetical protein
MDKEKPLGGGTPSGMGRDIIPDNGHTLFDFLSREGIYLLPAENVYLPVA